MKMAISIPERTFKDAETLAKRLGMSRSRLYTLAIQKFLDEERPSRVTDRLNDIYSKESSEMDPVLNAMQMASLPPEDW